MNITHFPHAIVSSLHSVKISGTNIIKKNALMILVTITIQNVLLKIHHHSATR